MQVTRRKTEEIELKDVMNYNISKRSLGMLLTSFNTIA